MQPVASPISLESQRSLAREDRLARLLVAIPLSFILIAGLISAFTSTTHLHVDDAGYFSWSYSFLVDGELDPTRALRTWSPQSFPVRTVAGRELAPNKFPIGWSLATLPFAGAGRVLAALRQDDPLSDATFDTLVHAARVGVIFWVIVGYFCAYRALAALISPVSAAGALLLTWLGTSALAYTWRDLNMSHAISLSFICITYYAGVKSTEMRRPLGYAALLGLAAGIVVTTRLVNFVLILPAFGLLAATLVPPDRAATDTRRLMANLQRRPVRRAAELLGVALVGAMLPVLLQLAVWKQVYGTWFFNGYAGEGFAFNAGDFARVLASSRHGLFFWHPVTLVCLAGLGLGIAAMSRNRGGAAFLVACAAALVVMTVAYGSWSTWSLGWSFGARWAADPFFLWALGLALFAERFLPGGNVKRFVPLFLLAAVSAALIVGQIAHVLPRDDYLQVHIPGGPTIELP